MSTCVQNVLSKLYPLGFKSDFKQLFRIAFPVVLTNISTFLLSTVSMLFCGHIGKDELGAVSLANTIINILGLGNVLGLSSACDTLLPQFYGSENKKEVGIVLQRGILITLISAFPAIGLLLNSRHLIIAIGQDVEIIDFVDEYILIYLPSLFFYGMSNILSKYLQAQNAVYPVLIMNFIMNILNVVFHAIFIFGFKLGVRGSALAITCSHLFLLIIVFCYIYFSKIYKITWPGWSVKCLDDWKTYLKFGIPGLVMLIMEWLTFEVGTFLAGTLGTVDLGAQAIVQQLLVSCFMIPYGIAVSGNIYIGQLLGANKPENAKNVYRIVLTMSGCVMAFLSIVLLSTKDVLPYLFSDDKDIINLTSNLLIVMAFIHLLDGSQGTFAGIIRSVGKQFYGTIMNFIGFYVLGLPIGLTLMLKTSLRVYGFWVGIAIGSTTLVIMQLIYTWRINWHKEAELAIQRAKLDEMLKIEECRKVTDEVQQKDNSIYKGLLLKKLIAALLIILISSIGIITRGLEIKQIHHNGNDTNANTDAIIYANANLTLIKNI